MRVVGLVSSPRRGGNSELAVKEILNSLPGDWEKDMIRINELDIENCRACYSCVPTGSKCVIKDDFDFLVRNVKHADKVVIAAPAYMLGGHTCIKRALDRLISLVSDYSLFNYTDCVMVASYGYNGWEGLVKEDMLLFAKKFHLNVIGTEVMLATLPGDSVKGENLERLHRLASVLEAGAVPYERADGAELTDAEKMTVRQAPTSDALECPYCSSTALHIKPDGSVRCCVCAGEGKLVSGANGFEIEHDPTFDHHFTHANLDGHVNYLAEKKQLFLDTRADIKALQAKYADMDWWIKPEKK